MGSLEVVSFLLKLIGCWRIRGYILRSGAAVTRPKGSATCTLTNLLMLPVEASSGEEVTSSHQAKRLAPSRVSQFSPRLPPLIPPL